MSRGTLQVCRLSVGAFLFMTAEVFFTSQVEGGPAPFRVMLQFHEIGGCKGVEFPLEVKSTYIGRAKSKPDMLNANLYNHEQLKKFSKMELAVTKCKDSVSPCEYETTLKYDVGICQILVAQKMPWTSVVSAVHPPFRCPLNKGAYELRNATIDIDTLLKSVGRSLLENRFGNVFVLEIRGFNEKNNLHVCFTSKFTVLRA